MRRWLTTPLTSLLTLLALTSCSNSPHPAAPASTPLDPDEPLSLGGYIGPDVAQAPFGRYQLQVSPDGVEILPARLAQAPLGTHFNVDVTDAFSKTFCTDCLRVVSFEKRDGGVSVELEIEHPFALADSGAPVSASNRRDLWLSSVKGILLLDSLKSWFNSTVSLDWFHLANADGHTNLLQPPGGFSANVFPYKVFGVTPQNAGIGNFDGTVGWTANYDDPSGYLVLGNAQTARARYDLTLLKEELVTWDLVLTATYAVSAATRETRLAPTHFMPAGAPPEPWLVRAIADGPVEAGNAASSTSLNIQVLDFQQDSSLNVDPNFPDPLNRRGLKVSSDIAAVHLSIPEMTGIEVDPIDISGATGQGTIAAPWTVSATINNTLALNEGRYYGVVKVVDERDPNDAAAPVTFISKDLVTPYTAPMEFATYAVFYIDALGKTDCLPFDQFHAGEAELYTASEPLYDVADSRGELDALVAQLTAQPIAYPPLDFTTQKVIVACTGWTDSGFGARTADVLDVCPNATLGYTIRIERGEPLGGCPTLPIATAPFVLAVYDATSPEFSFEEVLVDTCGGGPCNPVSFTELDSGDAWLMGGTYFEGANAWLVTTPAQYDSIGNPFYGANPKPPIDFRGTAAIITTAGFSAPQDGHRYSQVTSVCENPSTGGLEINWERGEYLTCTPNGEFPSTPFQIVTIPQPSGGADFFESVVDVCQPGGNCDDPLPITFLAQADVHNSSATGESYERYTVGPAFNSAWTRYFPEITPPAPDFGEVDAWILALPTVQGSGVERLEVISVCYDPGANAVDVALNHYRPLTPFCASSDSAPSRLVTVFTTPKLVTPDDPEINFTKDDADFCSAPGCGGPGLEVIGEGNGAAHWASGFGTDMVIFDQPTLNQVWRSVNGPTANAPTVDFQTLTVLFSTTGFHNQGAELYGLEINSGCELGQSSSMSRIDKVPQTCPPPLPVPTSPFQFVTIPNGGPGQIPAYSFFRIVQDACDPGADCVPELTTELAFGDYPENTKPGQAFAVASNPTELTSIWNAFFTNPGTRPPEPTVNFTTHDVILHSSGFTADGSGQRTRNGFFLCVDAEGEYVRVESFLTEPLTCEPDPGASHPWSCNELPKGAAGWTVELLDEAFDSCAPPEECFDFEELGSDVGSTYTAPESKYQVIRGDDLDELKTNYRTAWAELGAGDPPGIDALERGDMVVMLIYGWPGSHRGLHTIAMDRICFNGLGLPFVDLTRETPLSGCNGIQVPTSPYAIYRVFDMGDVTMFNETTIDSCLP